MFHSPRQEPPGCGLGYTECPPPAGRPGPLEEPMRDKFAVVLAVCLLAPVAARADESEAHYSLCLSHKKAGKLEDAERECRIALQKRSDNVSAIYTLGTLLRAKNQLDEALKNFRIVKELEPQNALGWAGEGAVLLRLNRIDEAVV